MVIYFRDNKGELKMRTYNGISDFEEKSVSDGLEQGTDFLVVSGEARLGESSLIGSFTNLRKCLKDLDKELDHIGIEHFLNGSNSYKSSEDMFALIKEYCPLVDETTAEDILYNLEPNIYFEDYTDDIYKEKILESYHEITEGE